MLIMLFNTLVTVCLQHNLLRSPKDVTDMLLKDLYDRPRDELIAEADVDCWTDHQWQGVTMSLAALGCSRSRVDCEGQWRNHLSSTCNKAEWTGAEDAQLRQLVADHGTNSWQLVAAKLDARRKGWQCLQRYQKIKKRVTTSWSVGDDKLLTDAVMIYGDSSFSDLSYYMGDKTSDQVNIVY